MVNDILKMIDTVNRSSSHNLVMHESRKGVFTIFFFATMIGILLLSAISYEALMVGYENEIPQTSDDYTLTNLNSKIYEIRDNVIYFDSYEDNLSIGSIVVSGKYCLENVSLDYGMNSIDIDSCVDGFESGEYYIELYFQNVVQKESFFIR